MLEIPHLARVPRTWTAHHGRRIAARVALGLLDAGHIPPTPIASTPADLIRTGLQRWLDKQAGELHVLHFNLRYGDYAARAGVGDPQPAGASVALECDRWQVIDIGNKLKALQRAVPGLGSTVLHWIDAATQNRIPIFTPSRAFDMCCWLQWRGCTDESELLEEARLNGEKPTDLEYIKRADWDKSMPLWVSVASEEVKRPALERLARSRRKYQLSTKIARALLALIDTLNATPMFDEHQDHPVMPIACFLRWSPEDHAGRVWDEYADMLAQTGEYSDHVEFFEHCDNDEIGPQLCAWLEHLEPYFTFVRALEAVIALLAPRPQNLAEAFRGY